MYGTPSQRMPETEAMLTIAPLPCRSIYGSICLQVRNMLFRLTSLTQSQLSPCLDRTADFDPGQKGVNSPIFDDSLTERPIDGREKIILRLEPIESEMDREMSETYPFPPPQ